MRDNGRWIKTDKHVFGVIYNEHIEEFGVYSSFSNPCPSELSMQRQMVTEWGFKDSNRPLIKSIHMWDEEVPNGKRINQTDEYYIWCAKEEDE